MRRHADVHRGLAASSMSRRRRSGYWLGQPTEDGAVTIVDPALIEGTVEQQTQAVLDGGWLSCPAWAQSKQAQAVGSAQEKLPSAQGSNRQSSGRCRGPSPLPRSGDRPCRQECVGTCSASVVRPRAACVNRCRRRPDGLLATAFQAIISARPRHKREPHSRRRQSLCDVLGSVPAREEQGRSAQGVRLARECNPNRPRIIEPPGVAR